MGQEERPHLRGTTLSALRDEWAAEREAERLRLIHRVEAVFDGVELGDGVSLHQARAMDDYSSEAEVSAARSLDTETRWQDVPDEKIDRLADTLPFMDAKGMRFYLPRFMLFALKHEERSDFSSSFACDTAVYWADLRDTTDRFALMSPQQLDVVRAFAEFFRDDP